jgi:hypothetical protein
MNSSDIYMNIYNSYIAPTATLTATIATRTVATATVQDRFQQPQEQLQQLQ